MPLSLKNSIHTILPTILISLLFVTPFMVSDQLYNGVVMAKEFWFFGIVSAMLLYWGISLLFQKDSIKIRLNITDILLIAFYSWCFIRACFTPYTPFYYNHKLQILTGMMVVYLFVKRTIHNEGMNNENITFSPNSFIYSFIILSFILSGFLQAVYGLLQLYGVMPSHHNLFKITGSFFNPAPYALYLAIVFPIALGIIINTENLIIKNVEKSSKGLVSYIKHFPPFFFLHSSFFIYCLSFATVIAILLVLPATMNRASWLGALAGSLVVFQYRYNWTGRIKIWLDSSLKRIMAVTLTISLLVSASLGLFYLKAGSSNGRLFIWEVTLGKILEKPLVGHGLGRFEAEYNNWQAEYFQNHPKEMDGPKGWVAGNTKYAFNEFLEIASEVGIVGLLLFAAIIVSIFYSISSPLILNSSLLISSLISLLVCAAISFPFYSLPTLMLLFVLAGVATGSKEILYHLAIHSLTARFAFACLLVALTVSCVTRLQKESYYIKWNDANYLYAMSNYTEANNNFHEIITSLAFEGALWQQYGKSLQMDGNNEESVKALEKAGPYTSDYILNTTLGDAYKGLMQYGKAEAAYQHATYMEPHKLYPRYLLAKLYDETERKNKALEIAEDILNKEVKIKSEATEEIKTEMKRILTKYYKQ